MNFIFYVIIGLVGGVLGGMGMGGGTVLIPLLSIFMSVSQHSSQAINLISFLPMAVIALIFHAKNKLLDLKKIIWIIVPAIVSAVGGVYLAKLVDGNSLQRYFGIFLILLAVVQAITVLKKEKDE